MLRENRNRLAGMALAGALTVAFGGAAMAQDWTDGPPPDAVTYHDMHHYPAHYRAYGYDSPYAYDNGYDRGGYYDNGPQDVAGAVVGSAIGVADATAAAATGYPPYGYYARPYGYDPYYGNDWWGPYHNQYQGY